MNDKSNTMNQALIWDLTLSLKGFGPLALWSLPLCIGTGAGVKLWSFASFILSRAFIFLLLFGWIYPALFFQLLEGSNNLLAALGILLDGLGNWLTFSLIFEELVIIEAQGWPRKVRKKTRPSRVKLLIKKSDLALYSQLYFVWDRRTPNGIRAYSTDSAGSSDSSQNPSSSQNPTSSRSHPKPIRLTIQRMLACKSNRKIDPLWTISGTFLIQWVLWGHGLRKE